MRCPQTAEGYIDYSYVLEIVVGELNLPFNYLDEMTFAELVIVINARRKNELDHYKMMSYAVQGAMYAIHTGKSNPMTASANDDNNDNKQSSVEERKKEVETLNEMFS